jgi:hypothetical protein
MSEFSLYDLFRQSWNRDMTPAERATEILRRMDYDMHHPRSAELHGMITAAIQEAVNSELDRHAQEWDRKAAFGPVTFRPNPFLR